MIAAGISGAAATAVDVAALVLLVQHGTPVALAAFVASAAGAAVCFTSNKYIAFRDRGPVTWKQLGRFGIVAVTTALLMAALMEVVAVKLAVPYLIAKLICSGLVFLAWTYPAQRRLVFRSPSQSLSMRLSIGPSVR
jgi:putative flippase GtrA